MSTSNRKRTTAKKRTSSSKKNRNSKKQEDFSSFHTEVAIWITVALAALLILGNFGLCGQFGKVFSSVFFGTFGFIQYIVPIVIILLTGLLLANQFSSLAVKKSLLVIVLLCMLSAISQMIVDFDCKSAFEAAAYSFSNHTGGGAIGGGICVFLHKFFGKAGTVLIVGVTSMISLMLIFEKSVLKLLREAGVSTAEASRERKLRREELQRIREEEREKEEKRQEELNHTLEARRDTLRKKEKAEEIAQPGEFHDNLLSEQEAKKNGKKRKKKLIDLGKKFGLDTEFEGLDEEKEEEFVMPPVTGMSDSLTELTNRAMRDKQEQLQDAESETDKNGKRVEFQWGEELQTEAVQEAKQKSQTEKIPEMNWNQADICEFSGEEVQDCVKVEEEKEAGQKSNPGSRSSGKGTGTETVHKENLKAARPAMDENVAQKMMEDMDEAAASVEKPYVFPPMDLLSKGENSNSIKQQKTLRATAMKLQQTLANFGVNVTITNVSCGPSVTRYELQPEQGVKVSKIVGLADDIKLNLAAADIRIEAPIPGKAAIGIEVPNKHNEVVKFRDLIDNEGFHKFSSNLVFTVGKDIGGKIILSDISKMPHLLIAGATGSGKSVCINTLIMSILYKANPNDVKFIMIDPKVVELSTYNGIPHLLIPVVTDPQKAAGALNWAVVEMQDRYQKFAEYNVRNLQGYNKKVEEVLSSGEVSEEELKKMPQIVIIVDELADLMMAAPGEVESAIVRLSQLARAAGIHLVIATQRPSVNVITGLIKANVPSRIAFAVSSGVDSRTIIDMNGAEKLLGRGDMLFHPQGQQKPVRVQGAFISDQEVGAVVDFLKEHGPEDGSDQNISEQVSEKIENNIRMAVHSNDRDEYFEEAARFILTKEKASIGMIQRMFKVGFNRASRIMEQLADAGVVGPEEGTKPRKILMSEEQLEQYLEEYM